MVHWGCNSAMSLQQLRSVFCMCFADTDEHTTQSQSPCTASQVEKKKTRTNPKAPSRCWQAPALPPEGSARGWVVWEGEKHQGLCPPHSSSHLAAQQLTLSLSLSPEEEAVPSDIPSCPPKPPPSHPSLPKCTPREGDDESGRREAGGEATPSLPGWAPAHSQFGNEHLFPSFPSFFLSFLPVASGGS